MARQLRVVYVEVVAALCAAFLNYCVYIMVC